MGVENIIGQFQFRHGPYPNIDYSLWVDQSVPEEHIARLKTYIDSPIVQDNFGTRHIQRRAWRNELSPEILRIVHDENPIRINSYAIPQLSTMRLTRTYQGTNSEQIIGYMEKYIEGVDGEEYKTLPFSIKRKLAQKSQRTALELLHFLSEQTHK